MNRLPSIKSDALIAALKVKGLSGEDSDIVVVRGELSEMAATQVADQFDAACGTTLSKFGWTAVELVRG